MTRPAPSSEDTGSVMPANCVAGISVPIMAKNIAAIWLLVTAEASRPMPVAAKLNTSAARDSVAKLPVMGTPNTVTASAHISRKFSMASPT